MNDLQRVKYVNLMSDIEDLEDEIEEFEKGDGIDPEIESPERVAESLTVLREKLASKRNELSRLSDGCGHGHHSHS
jgi:hypothetical protein